VRDPVYARALVLASGDARVALVSCDLLTVPASLEAAVVERLEGWSEAEVILAATHTHCAPDSQRLNRRMRIPVPGIATFDPDALAWTADRIAEAIREASLSLRPVSLWAGSAEVGLSRQRRGSAPSSTLEPPGLQAWARRLHGAKVLERPDAVDVAELRRSDGSILALLVNYAAHPTIFDETMMEISAEWPGELAAAWERRHPSSLLLFFNGALGDRSPVADDGRSDEERVELYASRLMRAVEMARSAARPVGGRLSVRSAVARLPEPQAHPDLVKQLTTQGVPKALVAAAIKGFAPEQAPCTVVRVGDWALLAVPGEPTTRVGQALRGFVGDPAFLVSFADDWVGYVLAREEYASGGYEATVSFHGPGLADALCEGFRRALRGSQKPSGRRVRAAH
jgi:neutral ceramidase